MKNMPEKEKSLIDFDKGLRRFTDNDTIIIEKRADEKDRKKAMTLFGLEEDLEGEN